MRGATTLSRVVAEQISMLAYDTLPSEVVLVAKQCFLDTVGVALAARGEAVTQAVRAVVLAEGGDGCSSLLDGSAEKTSARAAALVNGTAAHALELDDMFPEMAGHPSAPLVPAVLALAEERRASGREMVTAFVAGFETQVRIGSAVMPSHYARGFHPTGTAAAFGVAAAAARLLDLDVEQTQAAISIAATQAAGLKAMFGTMMKPVHAGNAAANGIVAAQLAGAGVSAAPDAIEGPVGFAATQADGLDRALLLRPFAAPWALPRTVFKRHAACGYTHAAVECAMALRDEFRDDATLHLTVHPEAVSAAGIMTPATPTEAKFSLWFTAALGLLHGRVDADLFGEAGVDDPSTKDVMRRVQVVTSSSMTRLGCAAEVRRAGAVVGSVVRDCAHPLWDHHPDEQTPKLEAKFRRLVDPVLGGAAAQDLRRSLLELETLDDARNLLKAVHG